MFGDPRRESPTPDEPSDAEDDNARDDERIDEAGRESFPASDPPATWSGVDPRDMDTEVGVEAPDRRAEGSS